MSVMSNSKARLRIEDWVRRDRDQLVDLCRDLVKIPTDNPPGDTAAAFAYIGDYLTKLGVHHELVTLDPARPNLLASFDGGEPGQHLVLNGHLDVFPAGDAGLWASDPRSGEVVNGKFYGRGVADMKGGVAVALMTFRYLFEMKDAIRGRLTLTLVSDEESFGPAGARHLVEQRHDVLGDCMLSGEPATPYVVRLGERGLIWIAVTTMGGGGHGSYGAPNAITRNMAVINNLQKLTNIRAVAPRELSSAYTASSRAFRQAFNRDLGKNLKAVSVNVGVIGGGTKVNMVAADCVSEVDVRCPIGVSTDTVLAAIDEIVGATDGASFKVINRFEPNYSSPDNAMFRILTRNAAKARNLKPTPGLGVGSTDCRLWRYAGVPSYIYGPTPYNMGAPDEHVTLEDFFAMMSTHALSAFDYLAPS